MSRGFSDTAGTFRDARSEPIHRWFPWIEGFAEELPRAAMEQHSPASIYDPFLGSGTTAVLALRSGLDAGGAEVNPFLRFVIRVKTVVAGRLALEDPDRVEERLLRLVERAEAAPARGDQVNGLFLDADFFERVALADIGRVKATIEEGAESPFDRDLARLALARVLVDSSNMIRRTDLRRRRANETNGQGKKVMPRFRATIELMLEDLRWLGAELEAGADWGRLGAIATDARTLPLAGEPSYDLCVTSPPYLNGTNYVRNTKLELWVLDLISDPADLRSLRDRAVTAGINNVRLRSGKALAGNSRLDRVLAELEQRAYDRRIPAMVAGYFADMDQVLHAVGMRLRPGSPIHLDIGDSRFAGVHVPTDQLLIEIAAARDLRLVEAPKLRDRRSYDGTPLVQRLLVFETPARRGQRRAGGSPANRLKRIVRDRPFGQAPYAARNWGHPWHSMCSYQGKLKPSIAHFLVKEFSRPGEVVLDPFSGAGTIPLEACLQGRVGWGNDISPLASVLTSAKVNRPDPRRVHELGEELLGSLDQRAERAEPEAVAGWGMNRSLGEYFHPRTLAELLAARSWFLEREREPAADLLWAATAHLLHGNRPYALSRKSHPITPFAPSGPSEYRPLRPRLADKVERLLAADLGEEWADGIATQEDVTGLRADARADVVITSPPFFGSTRFHSANWMRLWFCGWEPDQFKDERTRFIEYLQARDMAIYERVFAAVHATLRSGGIAIWHLGKSARLDMAVELTRLGDPWFSFEGCFEEDVTSCQSHGVSDQGATSAHQFLMLAAR